MIIIYVYNNKNVKILSYIILNDCMIYRYKHKYISYKKMKIGSYKIWFKHIRWLYNTVDHEIYLLNSK